MVTSTHFWDPDLGDNSTFIWGTHSYTNAYQKARKHLYGGYELRVPYPANRIIEAYNAPPNLFQFYKDGQIYYKGYYVIPTGEFVPRNRWHTASLEFRNKIVWEILGRVSHLLGDMTVPAHTHNDPHPADLDPDSYEEWMNQPSIYNQWTYWNAITQGGIINPTLSSNPLKYLFYPTAQTTNFFSSNDVDGNNIPGINDPFNYYPGLEEMIQHLNGEFGGPPNKAVRWLSGTSEHAFVYGIRAIAGFLYWFAKEADLLPIPLTGVSLIGDFTLYAGGTGSWFVTLQNGIEPFTYKWEIMYLDGTGYLQTYESVKKGKEKKEKDKKKDGDIIIEAAPSNSWFSIGTNSPYFYKPHNPYDLRDFKLRCTVTDGSSTTKTSNEWLVDVVSTPPPQGNIIADNKNNGVNSSTKYLEEITVQADYVLEQNYPNPFNPSTKISYSLPQESFVTLKIYDILGREVVTLVNEVKPAGKYEAEFNASKFSSGTYVYKLAAGNYQITEVTQSIKT